MNVYLSFYTIINKYRKYIPPLVDIFIAIISYIIPYLATDIHNVNIAITGNSLILYVFAYYIVFMFLKVYKYMWRYSGIEDIFRCLKASILANIIFIAITKLFNIDIRLFVYLFALALSTLMSIGIRIVYRALLIIGKRQSSAPILTREKNIMVIGAGQATMMILNEISSNNPQNYSVKCIIDDEDNKIGRMINSVPVVGNTDSIIKMSKKYKIEEIIFSIPSIDKENKKRILDICAKTGCKLRILPEIYSLITNETNNDLVGQLRDVQLEDLLGREEIRLECSWINKYIKNKTVLVTGGGGSIGSEICRQIAMNSPKYLIILDIYENNAYQIQQELMRTHGDSLNMEVEIASIRDKAKMEKLFSTRNIDIVFHAAAHKHVPLMEKNPEEAIKNNILGTLNLVELSDRYNVEKFIQISTDKAVNPTNFMGATKRVCEMIIQSYDIISKTDYVAVRFGNVLGSNGSVIPLFMDQIKAGGPVTITHEDITRYFMTIPEAVQLVLRAATIAEGGEIFVLDMGEPVKIKDLAYNLIRLSGLEPEVDIEIKYTGLRPGEKLYEELLITSDNNQTSTVIDKVFIEEPIPVDETILFDTIKNIECAARELDREKIFELMEKLVPTYKRTTNCVEVDVYRLTKENVLECVESIIDKGHRNVLLYGAGEVAETIIEVVRDKKDSGLNIVAIADDNKAKIGTEMLGCKIVSKDSISEMNHEAIIITSYTYEEEIIKKLMEIGYPRDRVVRFFGR